jgi:hypothetical protein
MEDTSVDIEEYEPEFVEEEEEEEETGITEVSHLLGLVYVAEESMREIYRDLLGWLETCEACLEYIDPNENLARSFVRDGMIVTQVATNVEQACTWMQELSNVRQKVTILESYFSYHDPDALDYVQQGGGRDTYYDITQQSAVITGGINKYWIPKSRVRPTDKLKLARYKFRRDTIAVITRNPYTHPDPYQEVVQPLVKVDKFVEETFYERVIFNGQIIRGKEISTALVGTPEEPELSYEQVLTERETEEQAAVQQAGPQYYSDAHGDWFKSELHLVVTESHHNQYVLREPIYPEFEVDVYGNRIYDTTHSLAPLNLHAYTVMTRIWPYVDVEILINEMRKARQEGKPYWGPGPGSAVPLSKVRRSLAARTDYATGAILRSENPACKVLVPTVNHLAKRGFIQLQKRGNEFFLLPLISRLDYAVRTLTIEDSFNLVSSRGKYRPQVYKKNNRFYPRVGILTQSGSIIEPLFVRPGWCPDEATQLVKVYEKDATGSKTRVARIYERMTIGGIPFKGSAQLHPDEDTDYDPSGRFSMKKDWTKLYRDCFLKAVDQGNVQVVTSVKKIKGKLIYGLQAYKVYVLPKDQYSGPGGAAKHCVVFCDLDIGRMKISGHRLLDVVDESKLPS